MMPTSPHNHAANPAENDLDRLLGAYFKAQLKKPWPPPPPLPAHGAAPVEAATVLAERRVLEQVHSIPHPLRSSHSETRARWTLLASVILLLGGSWFIANGVPSSDRRHSPVTEIHGTRLLEAGTAGNPKALETLRETKAKDDDLKVPPPKVDLP
jgi:hypothetical protein